MNIRHFVAALAVTTAAAVGGAAPAALASTGGAPAPTPTSSGTSNTHNVTPPASGIMIKAGMHIVGFDAAVAKAHGYQIRTNAQGLQYSAKIGSVASPDSDPVKFGACGDSYIYYNAIGHRSVNPRYIASTFTGYDVTAPVVEGTWQATYHDNAGSGTVTDYSATNGTPYWSTEYDTLHSTSGYSWGEVDPNRAFVVLDNGGLCYSGGPWDSTTLY